MTEKILKETHPRWRADRGFTLVELTAAIVLVAVLAAVALPRFLDLREEARVATLQGIAGTMRSTAVLVQSKALVSGLQPAVSNPAASSGGNNRQNEFIIDTSFGSSEVDWRNLCPESEAELGDALTMLDFTTIRADIGGLKADVDNRFTRVGYDLTDNIGCYVEYDSFGDPNCTVTLTTVGCGG